jgi:hypothetical protein
VPGPVVLGREAELARLGNRLRLAGAGHGGAMVLTGEPGAGKTMLAEAVARLAAQAETAVAWGRFPDAASTPAYWPWSQVLRALPDGPRVQAARQRLNGDAPGPGEESIRQFRAYEAVSAALSEAAASGPVLAVIDDLHAADDASLGLLQLLAGDLHRMPVLCLFTARDTEPSRPLAQALGELLRHPGTGRLAVEAFSPADVAALLDRLTARPPSAEVVATLMSRTGGNPFYTTELVRLVSSEQRRGSLSDADVLALDVPSGIRDVLMHRVHRLPDDTQSLLTLAAVAGRELVPELLAHLAGLDAEHLLFNLEPAVAAGLVTPAEAGWGYRFRHPLIHESLYASTGQAGRARLHGRVATALEDLPAARTAVDVAQLAHHYLAAGPFGDPAKAVGYARQAAARAVRQGAWPDAVRHLRDALSAITPGPPGAGATRCDVLTELGQACRSGGMIAEAHRALADAVSLAHRLGDEDRELAAAVAFGAPALWGSREWGEPDTGLIPLLERQLSRIADTDCPGPAWRLGRLDAAAGHARAGMALEPGSGGLAVTGPQTWADRPSRAKSHPSHRDWQGGPHEARHARADRLAHAAPPLRAVGVDRQPADRGAGRARSRCHAVRHARLGDGSRARRCLPARLRGRCRAGRPGLGSAARLARTGPIGRVRPGA